MNILKSSCSEYFYSQVQAKIFKTFYVPLEVINSYLETKSFVNNNNNIQFFF